MLIIGLYFTEIFAMLPECLVVFNPLKTGNDFLITIPVRNLYIAME